ncbi:Hypothetical protein BSPT1_I0322 [Brucella suis bv. 2]|nr:Hypothetical protein BSPT1_I0322 [Brucella suis bv. 2]
MPQATSHDRHWQSWLEWVYEARKFPLGRRPGKIPGKAIARQA